MTRPRAAGLALRVAALAAVAALLAGGAALAQEAPMPPEDFEAYTEGQTLYFAEDGAVYGAESYRPGRRVRWSYLDGRCSEGRWFPGPAGAICFEYDDQAEVHCWQFYARAEGLEARYLGEGAAMRLFEAGRSTAPLLCTGPEVGV